MVSFALVTLAVAATVRALPEITPIVRENTCSNWPFYRQFSSVAGPWTLFASSTGTDIDNNKASYVTFSDTSLAAGWLSISSRNDTATPQVQCQAFGSSDMLAVNIGGRFEPLSVSAYTYHNYDGLIFARTVTRGAPIQPHWHFFANGTRQPGTFLGWNNQTTWAFRRLEDANSFRVRLLFAGTPGLVDGEFAGFLRAGFAELDD
ncbi:hypothetical protein GGS23DRAFT_314984 [Durotheca rogersii]|uniref:uncharacterized protein n=1 Tax=Durotheca rogersii TaxID=419775 RepID=UPI00221FD321|nr:uncharacterized protein GGS23DRAFT_314984 [Durotheca rogersii]KAI5859605.1 hypothetical protein GGS23DRAFT_314984 [Durotheca rogersii]